MKSYLKIAAVIMMVAASFVFIASCSPGSARQASSYPSDFEFTLSYGMGTGNMLNTFDNTFTKDLITKGTAKTGLKLTQAEKDTIYKAMMRINIMDYPEAFQPPNSDDPADNFPAGHVPSNSYRFHIRMHGREKDIMWNDFNDSRAKKAVDLMEVIILIEQIVNSRPEVKSLPPAEGAYQ